MYSSLPRLASKRFMRLYLFLCVLAALIMTATQPVNLAATPQDTLRTIVSDDFIRNRPKASAKSGKSRTARNRKSSRVYSLASAPSIGIAPGTSSGAFVQLGLTVWKLRPRISATGIRQAMRENGRPRLQWVAERVEADTKFHRGEFLRFSIESPLTGYLYVIDRDWFKDGTYGKTNLIFPLGDDDNRLQAGRLIDIPAEDQDPFEASPEPNQAGELLTIIVSSSPLRLPTSNQPLRISNTQLAEWVEMWGARTERFEMKGGAGQVRTIEEEQAAARKGTRQLTRNDPGPQTIYLLTPKTTGAFLFNVTLSYVK